MDDFTGLTAIITGGSSGIGAATAALLQARGAHVAVLDRQPQPAADGILTLSCDVTDDASVLDAVRTTVGTFGSLDIVVNNAGIGSVGDVSQNDDAEWAHVLDVNLIGAARVSRAALPHLRTSDHPAIVNLCSAVAFVGVRQRALYSASKGGVLALTLAMAADHAAEGIRVNAVAPGTADTPWVARLLDSADNPATAAQALRDRQPLGRLVTADEVAISIAYLASPAAAAATGTILRMDGGMTTLRL
ncbi:SDR family NAD(P)-dependent oxidoreductase [Streptomyces shenzhenensis]